MRPLLVGGVLVWTAVLGFAQKGPEPPVSTHSRPAILNEASVEGFERTVKPFLAANCVSCHGNEKHKKDLNFEKFTSVETLIADRDRWDAVVEMLRNREMPPEDEPQPTLGWKSNRRQEGQLRATLDQPAQQHDCQPHRSEQQPE